MPFPWRTRTIGVKRDMSAAIAFDAARAARRRFLLIGALGALVLLVGATATATAAPRYRVKRLCAAARHGSAPSMSARLLPATVASAPGAVRPSAAAPNAVEEPNPWPGFLTAQRLHEAYSLPDETAAASGQTIAVVDAFNDPTAEQDLAVYDETF